MPLADVVIFCVLIGFGHSLRTSHIASFTAAMALNYLLKIRPAVVLTGRAWNWPLHCRLLAVTLMALFLRGGVLGLLSVHWNWPAQLSIFAAVIAGTAVTAAGYPQALSTSGDRSRALAIGFIGYAFALRLVYLGSVELLPEECYYWNYSRHLDIGYLDHPPMVAWLIRLGTAAFGNSQFGVRVGALCCSIITAVYSYRLTRNLFGETSALAAVVLTQALPFFFLSGFLMTPDAPLAAAWAASLFYLERALVAGESRAWWRVGLALGMGAISKYSIGLLVPVAVAFMLWDVKSRRWWIRWEPYSAALIALAVFSPVILWNVQHEWASFAFQTSRRLAETSRFALHKLIASSIVLITPTGVLAVAAGTGNFNSPRQRRFIALAILIPLAVFALFSLRHEVKLDWTGAPWIAALPVIAAGMISSDAAGFGGLRAWVRAAWNPTLAIVLLIFGAGLHYLVLGLPGLGYGTHPELVPVGWRELSNRIAAIAAANPGNDGRDPLIVGMDRYAIASELAFYGDERTHLAVETSSAHLFGGLGLMYERWTPPLSQEGRTLLLVAWDPNELAGKNIDAHSEHLGPIEDGILTRDGRIVRHYYHRLAYNYRPNP